MGVNQNKVGTALFISRHDERCFRMKRVSGRASGRAGRKRVAREVLMHQVSASGRFHDVPSRGTLEPHR